MAKAEAALTRALALDDSDAESYNVLAGIQLYYHRDWMAAERSLRKGLELNANSGQLHNHYARCLYLFGRNDEAIAEMRRAIDLEPFSIFTIQTWAASTFLSGNMTMRGINSAGRSSWSRIRGLHTIGWATWYEMKGIQNEAVAEWSRALVLGEEGEMAANLERVYAASGFEAARTSLWRRRVERLNEQEKRSQYVPAIEYVNAYARSGDKEQAFAWLEKALEERNRSAFEVKSNPMYENLRNDPRFQDLLQRAGFN